MKKSHIRFTATAREYVRREQALKIIAVLPGAGALYTQSPVPGVHLRRIDAHLYYTFDDEHVIAEKSGHYVHRLSPQIVIDAVELILKRQRARPR